MAFLDDLNRSLGELEAALPVPVDAPHSVFIIGVPRSGTTLVSQLFAGCTDAGYVSNVMARFWAAPAVGASLSKEIVKHRRFTGQSKDGQTRYPEEPHEFGGFWRRFLNYSDMSQKASDSGIDWTGLLDALRRVSAAFERPVVYKVFQLYWHLATFQKLAPTSKWIWVRRDLADNALSLLRLRERMAGSRERWVSAYPLGSEEFTTESPWVQVVAQVLLIERWIMNELAKIPEAAWRMVSLGELVGDPLAQSRALGQFAGVRVLEDELVSATPRIGHARPARCESTDRRRVAEATKRLESLMHADLHY